MRTVGLITKEVKPEREERKQVQAPGEEQAPKEEEEQKKKG